MNNNRITNHPILGNLEEEKTLTFTFNGKTYKGLEGDTIASALLANGIRKLRVQESAGTPRGIYCNIGHCFECRVIVNQKPGIRACLTKLEANMNVESGETVSTPLDPSIPAEELPRTYAEFSQKNRNKKEDN